MKVHVLAVISGHLSVKELICKATASDFIRKVGETFATRIILIALGMVTTVLVARILGPEGRGLYAVATTVAALGVQFGNMGLHASNTYSVAKDRTLLPQIVGNTLAVSFGLGGFGVLVAWGVFTIWPSIAPLKGLLLFLSLLWVPFGLAYLLLQNILIGIHEIRAYNKIEIYSKIIAVVFILILIAFKMVSVEFLIVSGLIVLIISGVLTYRRIATHLKTPPQMSHTTFIDYYSYGLKAYLASLLAFLTLKANLLMIQYMLGPEQTGYFSVAATIADLVYMLPVVVGTILFPKLSSINDKVAKYNLTVKVTSAVGFIMLIICVLSILLAKPLIAIMFGVSFLPSSIVYLWLLPGILFLSLQTIMVQYLNSNGFPRGIVMIWLIAFVICVICNFLLIPRLGLVGAAISSSVSNIVAFILIVIMTATFNRVEHV